MLENEGIKLLNIISQNIKTYRKILNISQLELASRIGTSQGFIGDLERAKKSPSVAMISNIAKNLGIEPYELLIDKKSQVKDNQDIVNKISSELKRELESAYLNYFKNLI